MGVSSGQGGEGIFHNDNNHACMTPLGRPSDACLPCEHKTVAGQETRTQTEDDISNGSAGTLPR